MKRLTFTLLALLLVLAACSQPPPVDASGAWSGQLDNAEVVSFTVDERNEVEPYDFQATYQGRYFDYEVSNSVRGDRFTLTAVATTPDLQIRLDVEATVDGGSMTGTYELSVEGPEGTFRTNGTFSAQRM